MSSVRKLVMVALLSVFIPLSFAFKIPFIHDISFCPKAGIEMEGVCLACGWIANTKHIPLKAVHAGVCTFYGKKLCHIKCGGGK